MGFIQNAGVSGCRSAPLTVGADHGPCRCPGRRDYGLREPPGPRAAALTRPGPGTAPARPLPALAAAAALGTERAGLGCSRSLCGTGPRLPEAPGAGASRAGPAASGAAGRARRWERSPAGPPLRSGAGLGVRGSLREACGGEPLGLVDGAGSRAMGAGTGGKGWDWRDIERNGWKWSGLGKREERVMLKLLWGSGRVWSWEGAGSAQSCVSAAEVWLPCWCSAEEMLTMRNVVLHVKFTETHILQVFAWLS